MAVQVQVLRAGHAVGGDLAPQLPAGHAAEVPLWEGRHLCSCTTNPVRCLLSDVQTLAGWLVRVLEHLGLINGAAMSVCGQRH